jgi:hypothetical protein
MQTANATTCFPMFATPGLAADVLAELPPQAEMSSAIAITEPANEVARRRQHLRSLALVVDDDEAVCM